MGKTMQNFTEQTHTLGLYDPQFEHDACGIGAVVDINASVAIVSKSFRIQSYR